MRSDSRQRGQGRPTFIEEARRKQIVDTAIRTIATRGYSGTSLAEIAREAGISKGVISYHFEGKGELVEEILSRLMREPAEFIKQRVDAWSRAQEKLRAYVAANFEFAKSHRDHLLALVDLWGRRDSSEGRNRFDAEAYEPSRKYLSRILHSGMQCGELEPVPTNTMASVIQAAIDGVLLQWTFDPDAVDLDACREEIQNMITRHVVRTDAEAALEEEEA
jgi:AcrR family transcriptional regulator